MYRRVQRLGIQGKYEMNEEFRLRVKMLSALAFPPQEDISRAFEELSPQFGGAEMELLQYFDRTYVGYTIGNVRRGPLFEVEIWRVGGREDVVITRANNAVEGPHHAFSSGLAEAGHLGVWRFVETLQSQQNITDKDIADVEMGAEKTPRRRQGERNNRILVLTGRYRRDGDKLTLARGVARNYMRVVICECVCVWCVLV